MGKFTVPDADCHEPDKTDNFEQEKGVANLCTFLGGAHEESRSRDHRHKENDSLSAPHLRRNCPGVTIVTNDQQGGRGVLRGFFLPSYKIVSG